MQGEPVRFMEVIMRSLRAVAVNPVTQWAQAFLNLITAIVAVLGYTWFMVTKKGFADVI